LASLVKRQISSYNAGKFNLAGATYPDLRYFTVVLPVATIQSGIV